MEALAEAIEACRPKSLFPAAASPSTAEGAIRGADLFDLLADDLLFLLIAKLPAKDAVATSILSRRWRQLWASVPLRLDDGDLLYRRDGSRLGPDRLVVAVSSALDSHPGPFLAVHIGHCLSADIHGDEVARWLQVLAAKGVRDLALLGQGLPFPLPVDPVGVFGCVSLRRLFLGVLSLPTVPDGAAFPDLQELLLCCSRVAEQDLLRLMGGNPKLRALELLAGNYTIPRLNLSSGSLRRLLLWKVMVKVLVIVNAPQLDSLVLWQVSPLPLPAGFRTRIEIRCASELRLIGYLNPANNILVIGESVIKGSTKPTPKTMLPSLKVIGLKVCLGSRKEAWMTQGYLRCFPRVQTLHIISDDVSEVSEVQDFKCWKEADPIECLSHIKKVTFYGVPWSKGNLEFLKFVLEGAYLLEEITISLPKASYTGMHSVMIKLKLSSLTSVRWASNICQMKVRYKGDDFNYDKASDPAVVDPLDCSP